MNDSHQVFNHHINLHAYFPAIFFHHKCKPEGRYGMPVSKWKDARTNLRGEIIFLACATYAAIDNDAFFLGSATQERSHIRFIEIPMTGGQALGC